jgi:carbamoyltransferase
MSALRNGMNSGDLGRTRRRGRLIEGERVLFAVNEERLTRRKLEVGFPELSITACLRSADLTPADIPMVAASTTDPAKTLTRLLPGLKEEYYLIRRRKRVPHRADPFRKAFKYRFTELPPNPFSAALSRAYMQRRLARMGFADFRLEWVEHHAAHAAAAAACSGFPEALVLTLDGVGDGLCGSLRIWRNGKFELLKALPARTSLGIFFEHVTNLMNMRELEDEGKVMALANYAYPIPDEENPLMALIGTRGLDIVSPYRSTRLFAELRKLLWRFPSEQFAFMAQRVLEKNVLSLVEEALARTGLKRLAAAGGVFSNVKMNMRLAELPSLERLYVFPHMGDGGLAIGAALAANRELNGVAVCHLDDLYLARFWRTLRRGEGPSSPASRPGFRVRRLEEGAGGCAPDPGRRDRPVVPGADGDRPACPGPPEHPRPSGRSPDQGPPQPPAQEKGLVPALLSEPPDRGRAGAP